MTKLGETEEFKAITKEAKRWLLNNQTLELDNSHFYNSPRISSEIPDCSMPLTADTYKFCSLSCIFCFAYYMKANNPAIKNSATGMQLSSVDPKKFISAIEGHPMDKRGETLHRLFYSRKFLLHIGGLADPWCNFEAKNGIGYEITTALGDLNYPTLFSYKGATLLQKKYRDMFEKYSKQSNFAFQCSMVTGDNELSKIVEMGVPSPTTRLESLRMLSDMGYWTILRLRPYIIGVTDESLDILLEKALATGIKAISMEFYALDARASEDAQLRYDWLGKIMGTKDLMSYFQKLSPSSRGGYRRLNRLVKEIHVKKVYKFCIDNNLLFACSDPDFKELTMSGSCCGMPDVYEKNPLLQNWTRNQLTYHLKEGRLLYHREGEIKTFKFGDIYKDEPYFHERHLSHDHVIEVSMCAADRENLNYEKILRQYWNNLRSPANPSNYLDRKIIPCGLDADKNLIYKYNPMPYEAKWKAEGIDMVTR